MNILYPLIAVFIVSLISVIVAIPLLMKKKISEGVLLFLLSMSVGVLLSTVFINFLPEIYSEQVAHAHEISFKVPFSILAGFLVMFIVEKFIHAHHEKGCEGDHCGHSHAYNLAPVNLIGDGIHNFIDGLVIAGSFAVNTSVGIAATLSIIFHEIPQEIADFGVLLYSGLSRKKALLFNFLSALTSVLGVILGVYLIKNIHGFVELIIPFAAGNFTYIAATNLLPELHRHCKLKDSIIHLTAILIGIGIVVLVTLFAPEHAH